MRHPVQAEVEAIRIVRHLMSGLGSNKPITLLWSPLHKTYVVAVQYDSRLQYRVPTHVTVNSSPYSEATPNQVSLGGYGMAVPVVMYTPLPSVLNPAMANLTFGYPAQTTRRGAGIGFPQVMFGDAPMVDGVAYNREDAQYCQASNIPDLQPRPVLDFPVQPACFPCSTQRL